MEQQLEEIKLILDDSKNKLEFIENYQPDIPTDKDISLPIKLSIKHFLENLKSCLDHLAFAIFEAYSAEHVPKYDQAVGRIYFPNRTTPKKFTEYMKNQFTKLEEKKPEIYYLFESYQPYHDEAEWYKDFDHLANTAKHRYLLKNDYRVNTHIRYANLGGNHFYGATFENTKTPITYYGTKIDFCKTYKIR